MNHSDKMPWNVEFIPFVVNFVNSQFTYEWIFMQQDAEKNNPQSLPACFHPIISNDTHPPSLLGNLKLNQITLSCRNLHISFWFVHRKQCFIQSEDPTHNLWFYGFSFASSLLGHPKTWTSVSLFFGCVVFFPYRKMKAFFSSSFTKLPHGCPNERHDCAKNWSENLPQIHPFFVVIYPCFSGEIPGHPSNPNQILMDACGKRTCHFVDWDPNLYAG